MEFKYIQKEHKPIIGISIGDYNGIGPEVILKALYSKRILQVCIPVIYGSMRILSYYRKKYNLRDWSVNQVNDIRNITPKKTNLVAFSQKSNFDISPGRITEDAGQYAYEALQAVVKDLKEAYLDAMVTAPINKNNIQNDSFKFPGHTEYLANAFGQKDNLMFMVGEHLRVALVTGHLPLSQVSNHLTRDKISTRVKQLLDTLQSDFNITKPRVAVLGLNPHAGEDGLFGDEEQQVIRPAILDMKKKGVLVYGPYSADGFFASGEYAKFDAVLAMYHDQGLIPFKTLSFGQGVNYTAGMPIVRTSPDHGTAYNIAGKNTANEQSLRQAIYLACDIVKNRR